MNDSEKEYISDLISHTRDSATFFSNSMKSERERSVCAVFLRCLGVDFTTNEIVVEKNDPPDAIFGLARFEIMELYEKGRKRHDEYRERLKELQQANSIKDTLISIKWPAPISYGLIYSIIGSELSTKAEKYGSDKCSSLDALVYVSLSKRFLNTNSEIPKFDKIMAQGWRSVSFVIPPYSHVVYCKEGAPKFLSEFEGKTRMEWNDSDSFFAI
jgi:hypothetical protein